VQEGQAEHLVFRMEYDKTIVDEFLILLSAVTTKSSAFTETRVAVEQFLEESMGTLLNPPQVVGSQLPAVSTLRQMKEVIMSKECARC
jgi:hypothetical protein